MKMPTLIAYLSSGKGTWSEVMKIMGSQEWDKVFLITNEFGEEKFKPGQNTKLILINIFQETDEISEVIKKGLEGEIKDFEVALSLVSGSGKEHMAVLKAVMELGLNFRLVTVGREGLMVL